MSTLASEFRMVRQGLDHRIAQARRVLGRTMPGPLLVRATAAGCGVGALAVAFGPLDPDARTTVALGVVGLLPALLPRGRVPTFVLVAAALGWLVTAGVTAGTVTVLRLVLLSALLYLLHSATALAAALPYDTVVPPRVLVGWFGRAAAVVALSTAFGLAMAALAQLAGRPASLVMSLVGLAAAAGLAVLLVAARIPPRE